jgi:hypothetical protein
MADGIGESEVRSPVELGEYLLTEYKNLEVFKSQGEELARCRTEIFDLRSCLERERELLEDSVVSHEMFEILKRDLVHSKDKLKAERSVYADLSSQFSASETKAERDKSDMGADYDSLLHDSRVQHDRATVRLAHLLGCLERTDARLSSSEGIASRLECFAHEVCDNVGEVRDEAIEDLVEYLECM